MKTELGQAYNIMKNEWQLQYWKQLGKYDLQKLWGCSCEFVFIESLIKSLQMTKLRVKTYFQVSGSLCVKFKLLIIFHTRYGLDRTK